MNDKKDNQTNDKQQDEYKPKLSNMCHQLDDAHCERIECQEFSGWTPAKCPARRRRIIRAGSVRCGASMRRRRYQTLTPKGWGPLMPIVFNDFAKNNTLRQPINLVRN